MNLIKMIFILSILSGTLYMNFSEFRIISFVLLILTLAVPIIFKRNLKIRLDSMMTILLVTLLVSGLFSSIFNQDTALLFGILSLVFTIAILMLYLPNVFDGEGNAIVHTSLYLVNFPLILLSVFFVGLINPSGIFENPNSYGIVLVLLLVGVCSNLYHILETYLLDNTERTPFKTIFYFVLLTFIFLLIIQTNSRTSFLIAIFLILLTSIMLIRIFITRLSYHSFRRIIFTSIFILSLVILVFLIFPIKEIFIDNIYHKFAFRSTQGDILSGRDIVWEWVLNNMNLFGHGREVFSQFGIGAHNTFISLLAQYGLMVLVVIVLILLIGLLSSFKFYIKNPLRKYNLLPLLLIFTFILQSMAEGMLFKSSMFYAFISIGIVIHENKKVGEE